MKSALESRVKRALLFPNRGFQSCLGCSRLLWGEKKGVGAQQGGKEEGREKEENFREGCVDQTWKWGAYLCAHVIDQTLLCGLESWETCRYLVAVEPGGKG